MIFGEADLLFWSSRNFECWFLRRKENRKTLGTRREPTTNLTHMAHWPELSRATLVRGERSHYCANPAPHTMMR